MDSPAAEKSVDVITDKYRKRIHQYFRTWKNIIDRKAKKKISRLHYKIWTIRK